MQKILQHIKLKSGLGVFYANMPGKGPGLLYRSLDTHRAQRFVVHRHSVRQYYKPKSRQKNKFLFSEL